MRRHIDADARDVGHARICLDIVAEGAHLGQFRRGGAAGVIGAEHVLVQGEMLLDDAGAARHGGQRGGGADGVIAEAGIDAEKSTLPRCTSVRAGGYLAMQ